MKKTLKKVTATLMAVFCCLLAPLSAFAAETDSSNLVNEQTVNSRAVHSFGPGMYQRVGSFTFTNNNWTPVKTIYPAGSLRHFHFNGAFEKADSYNGLVKLTLKVKRVSDGKIIFNKVFYPNSDGKGTFGTDVFWVDESKETEKVQLFFDASTYNATPPGPYRSLYVSYDCSVY